MEARRHGKIHNWQQDNSEFANSSLTSALRPSWSYLVERTCDDASKRLIPSHEAYASQVEFVEKCRTNGALPFISPEGEVGSYLFAPTESTLGELYVIATVGKIPKKDIEIGSDVGIYYLCELVSGAIHEFPPNVYPIGSVKIGSDNSVLLPHVTENGTSILTFSNSKFENIPITLPNGFDGCDFYFQHPIDSENAIGMVSGDILKVHLYKNTTHPDFGTWLDRYTQVVGVFDRISEKMLYIADYSISHIYRIYRDMNEDLYVWTQSNPKGWHLQSIDASGLNKSAFRTTEISDSPVLKGTLPQLFIYKCESESSEIPVLLLENLTKGTTHKIPHTSRIEEIFEASDGKLYVKCDREGAKRPGGFDRKKFGSFIFSLSDNEILTVGDAEVIDCKKPYIDTNGNYVWEVKTQDLEWKTYDFFTREIILELGDSSEDRDVFLEAHDFSEGFYLTNSGLGKMKLHHNEKEINPAMGYFFALSDYMQTNHNEFIPFCFASGTAFHMMPYRREVLASIMIEEFDCVVLGSLITHQYSA